MFERFTEPARAVVRGAQQEARALGHPCVGTEHLLLAMLEPASGVAAAVLRSAGVRRERVLVELGRLRGAGRGPLGPADAEALRAIGIDLDAVVAAIEETFGPDALQLPEPAAPGRRRHPLRPRHVLPRRRRRCQPAVVQRQLVQPQRGGHLPFEPRSKKVLELSLRESLRLHDKGIGTEHVLLGLLCEGEGLAAQILVAGGCSLDELRQRTLRARAEAA
jgi:ATP-dependent Clp protease ATP-binding subunit ClpA